MGSKEGPIEATDGLEATHPNGGDEFAVDEESGEGEFLCGHCGLELEEEDKFCRECGEISSLGRTVEAIEGFGEEEEFDWTQVVASTLGGIRVDSDASLPLYTPGTSPPPNIAPSRVCQWCGGMGCLSCNYSGVGGS